MKTQLILLSSLLFGLQACSNEEKTKAPEPTSIVATDANTKELQESLKDVAEEEKRLAEEAKANMTTMSFNVLNHEFGTVKEDTKHLYNFVVTNTGKKPLFIQDVKASCGCTTPKKPEKAIAPGKSDVIAVEFHPKVGQLGRQDKTVTVMANTNPGMVVLKIGADVVKNPATEQRISSN
jgi:flagellar biosynthesis regulator FlaF